MAGTTTKNVGTLKIKIEVEGASQAKKEISDVGKSGTTSLGGILAALNKFRWAMMSVQMVAGLFSTAFKFQLGIVSTTIKTIGTVISNSFLLPLKATLALIPMVTKAFAGIGTAFVLTGIKDLAKAELPIKEARPLFEFGAGGTGAIGTRPELDAEMMDKAISVASHYGLVLADVTSGFYDFASAGISAETALSAMNRAAEFALVSQMGVGEGIAFTFSQMRAFGQYTGEATQDVANMIEMQDKMAAAVLQSNMRFGEFQQALTYVAPTANALGIEFDQVAAAIAAIANNGVKGSKAGTGLNNILARLVKNTGEAGRAMGDLDISMSDFDKNDLPSLFEAIRMKLEGISDESKRDEVALNLFGLRASKVMGILSEGSVEDFRLHLEALGGSAGAVAKIAEVMRTSVANSLQRLSTEIVSIKTKSLDIFGGKQGFLFEFANSMEDNMQKISDGLKPMFESFNSWLREKIPLAINWLVSKLPLITKVTSEVFSTVSGIVSRLYSALMNSGVMQRIVGWFKENWSSVKTTILGIVDEIGFAFSESWKNFNVSGVLDNMKLALENFYGWLKNTGAGGTTGTEKITATFTKMGTLVETVVNKSTKFISEFFDSTSDDKGANSVLGSLDSVLDSISTTINELDATALVTALTNIATALSSIATSNVQTIIQNLVNLMSSEDFVDNMKTLVDSLSTLAGSLVTIGGWIVKHPVLAGALGLTAIGTGKVVTTAVGTGIASKVLGTAGAGTASTAAGSTTASTVVGGISSAGSWILGLLTTAGGIAAIVAASALVVSALIAKEATERTDTKVTRQTMLQINRDNVGGVNSDLLQMDLINNAEMYSSFAEKLTAGDWIDRLENLGIDPSSAEAATVMEKAGVDGDRGNFATPEPFAININLTSDE